MFAFVAGVLSCSLPIFSAPSRSSAASCGWAARSTDRNFAGYRALWLVICYPGGMKILNWESSHVGAVESHDRLVSGQGAVFSLSDQYPGPSTGYPLLSFHGGRARQ